MEGRRQLRLLLWRDYLIRKRKFITLAGVLWATGIMIGAYSVRINIDNLDFPTCQFAARALPSAGMLPFLQSFICSVNNECSPMDQYQEIPSYNNSKLTQIQGKLSPLFNSSVLELAGTMPDAVKLLSTVASAADEPTFIDFSKNGLKVMDLFKNPSRAKRYVTSRIQLDDDVAQSLMESEIRFQGILAGNMDLCSPDAISQTLMVQNSDHLQIISAKLCAMSKQDLQIMFMDLLYEVNFSKYIKMLGNMYSKISGDTRLTALGDFVTAVLRMTKLQHFLPPEAMAIFYGKKSDFSYLKLDLIPKFVELFASTFGETDQYQSIKELADTAVISIQYVSKIFGNLSNDTDNNINNGTKDGGQIDMDKINKMLDNVESVAVKADTIDPFTVLSKLANMIIKFLPKDKKHDFLFYSTLLSKLMESMFKVIQINMHIEEMTYNVTLRNPDAVKVLQKLDPVMVGKAFEALVSAERTQILTSNINAASEMFCDVSKLQKFLLVSQAEAESAKKQLCSDAWKIFVDDLVKSFGVGDVKYSINEMASLLIQETLGRDTSSLLYSIDQALDILRSFSSSLVTMGAGVRPEVPWRKLLAGGLERVVDEKAHLGKLMLISVHGAIAKEIVKQNAILQYKITPVLININTFVAAVNKQLAVTPSYVSEGLRGVYGEVVQTVLMTANDDVKTFRSLSTHCKDIACLGGDNASKYLQFPPGVDTDKLSDVLCNASIAIEAGLKNDSIVSKAIMKIMQSDHTALSVVNWTTLINNIQTLYVHLDKHYPYLFEYSTYAMDNATQEKIRKMCDNAKEYWFGIRNLQRAMHLSVNLGFRLLDILDYGIFNMTSETWLKIKLVATKTVGPLTVIDDTVKLVTALLTNSPHESRLPPMTVEAMNVIVPNLPQFIMDTVFLIIHDNTNIEPIISLMNASPPWPCSNASISEHLMMTSASDEAIAAMETLLCMGRSLQDEWIEYFTERDINLNIKTNYTTTQYAPHLFLKASSAFNALIDDSTLVKDAYKQLVDEDASDRIGLVKAWKYAVGFANSTEGPLMLSKFFTKFDTVLSSIDTTPINTDVSLNTLWEGYTSCIAEARADGCLREGRAMWSSALNVLALVSESAAEDMITYFTEVNAPGHDLLQVLGFTRSTALHSLYERLPEYISVLVNSYWDYGFMSQIRRATQTQFWDCDSVVSALVLPPGTRLQEDDIKRVKPYICPSLIYWLSLPRDDNVLFNIVAKPQYYFYSFHVAGANGSFERSFSKGMQLADVITDISKENKTTIKDELSLESLKVKLTKFIEDIINYRLKETDEAYKLFSEINKQQFISHVYLTRTVAILNKLATSISNITIDDKFITKENIKEEDIAKVTADLVTLKNIFKRKALDVIAIQYDLLTEVFWRQDDNYNYNIIDAMEDMCLNLNGNTSGVILADEGRVKAQICAKNYKIFYRAVHDTVAEDYTDAKQNLMNLVKVLQNGDESEVVDIADFLNNRTELVKSLKHSISFSYDLGLPIYLRHLQFNLQGYRVLLTFLSGGDWWGELRRLYDGPEARKFFGYVEQGFEVADHFVNNLDRIHLVRLIRDINLNDTRSFCDANLTLSDYLPDATGAVAVFKQQLCMADKVDIFRELPPLLVASQGYEAALKMSKDINYADLDKDISYMESNIGLISNGPKEPILPAWVTQEKLDSFRTNIINLLSKETLTKMVFGLMSNAVDAGTLFLDNSQCTLCSQMTTWFKQLNLQLFKKQEYDNLLCHLHTMSLDDIYYTLKNDFHWDMFVRELISSRNYTSYELNKSMTEFLAMTEAHLLDDMRAPTTKLAECLLTNVTRNAFGNVTLFFQVLSRTAKLLRAETPHLHQVDGITDLPYLKDLYTHVAHRVNIYRSLRDYLKTGADLRRELKERQWVRYDDVVMDLMEADVNLREANNGTEDISALLHLNTNQWEYVCVDHDCGDIFDIVNNNLNRTKIEHDLISFQSTEYWQFSFISSILGRIEEIFSHVARLSGVASLLDVPGVVEGRLPAMLDLLAGILMDDTVNGILYSVKGLIRELQPLLQENPLKADLQALHTGLGTLHQFKTYLVEEADLRLKVSTYFPNAESIEVGLTGLGINNTNFWSLAAPRIHAGYLQLKPVLSSKDRNFHISKYICDIDAMSQVLSPAELDVVSAEEVSAATVEQFCTLDEDVVKEMAMVLLRNADYATIIDKVKDHILTKLYSASDLTQEQGAAILHRFPRMAAVLPSLQGSLADVMQDLKDEPLFEDLKDFSSVGNLLTSPDFLAHAGSMMCGTPFKSASSRLLSNIIKSEDQATAASQAQLDVLPTEFCRSMYLDIISMEGGKIVWSFIKPLLMGKILYTPPVAAVNDIIHKANSSFATMIQMTSLVHSFSSAIPSLDLMSAHRDGISALQHLVSNPGMEGLRRQILGDVEINVDVEGMFQNVGDLKGIGKLIAKASDLLRCFNLDRFVATSNETTLMHEAAKLMQLNEFSAGLVFMNEDQLSRDLSNVEYKIRMDIENVPTTARKKALFWTPGPESSFIENMRYFRGFIQIQDMVDKAIIQLSADTELDPEGSRRKREVEKSELDWAVYTQQQPYPCYQKDYFQSSLYESQALVVCFSFALLFTVASVTRFIVQDKESGNTMLMSVMGVNLNYHTLSWFITSCCEMALTMVCVTLVLRCGAVLPRTEPSLLLALLLLFGASVLSFCYMMAKLFTSASFAAVCVSIAYLMSFLPFVVILSLEAVISLSSKLLVCLSMSSSLSYGLMFLTQLEAAGRGATWRDLFLAVTDEDISLASIVAMIIFDGLLYLFIGYLIDRYNGIRTLRSHIITSENDKAGVSIVNVSKTYSSGRRAKLALNNVSVELHKGQVTTLLGHNGAGKTTLTNILTGMVRPTSGHVVVRGGASARVGVCPQHDVLVDCLTAREHVQLYASLAACLSPHQLREEVDRMLEVLSLGGVADEHVSRLSGGTRRRVCVALAFVTQGALVSLDEPTSGVDPNARREIWDMIVKLKGERTILLTTHHLDEAEILSDQIVIMHKGQVHTTGSPIEIKRSLGSGYRLTVTLTDGDWSAEERAKLVVAAVRSQVSNAAVLDVAAPLEMVLPFYDAHGANNDFLQLCTTLEEQQEALGIASFTLDCSSLEQVFCDIVRNADNASTQEYNVTEAPLKSSTESGRGSSSSMESDGALVAGGGPRRGSRRRQLLALLRSRWLHLLRNRSLLFMLIILPTLFVTIAMAFSTLRPPPDNEVSLPLTESLYPGSTQYLLSNPSILSVNMGPGFARQVMGLLQINKTARTWTQQDSPKCNCSEIRQVCEASNATAPQLMILPDVNTLNNWITASHDLYVEKRYGGFSSTLKNNKTNLIMWYNNKGYHAMPVYLNTLNNAILRAVAGTDRNITTYSHPLKISKEQLNKDTLYQHVADAGIAALVLVALSAAAAGGSVPLVSARRSKQKTLQRLCAVSPALYWAAQLIQDLSIMFINMLLTGSMMLAFGFPVFVERNNLPAICILIMLFGYACCNLVHVLEKLFSSASLANMMLFCGNAFLGLAGMTVLLILDIISDSDATDNARWVLHKVFMLSPQFALGDGLLEVAKNTIQAQVLYRFGMDTYRDPLNSDLLRLHYCALVTVGTALLLLNLAIEYGYFDVIVTRFSSTYVESGASIADEPADVSAERRRVAASLADTRDRPLSLATLGNINRGFVHTEGKKNSLQRSVVTERDVAQCVGLSKAYPTRGLVVDNLTLGIAPGQCIALLGENGAGKSTTFSMLTGEVRPSRGQIYLDGKPRDARGLARGLISYCPQIDAIDPLLTVRETLHLYCELRGITDEDHVIDRAMDMFELSKYANVRSGALSGGNKRKLCTALAFTGRTPLVLLDEPTSGMDPVSRGCVWRACGAAAGARRGVLLSTHALDDARRAASGVALLRASRLIACQPLADCLDRFGGGYVVQCSCLDARAAWRGVARACRAAQLRLLHQSALHFHVPTRSTVEDKTVVTRLSDIFRVMSALQAAGAVEDYTLAQSSLEQMFLNYSEKGHAEDKISIEPLPSPHRTSDEHDTVTSL